MMKRLHFDMDNILVDFASGIAKLDAKTASKYEGRLDDVTGDLRTHGTDTRGYRDCSFAG